MPSIRIVAAAVLVASISFESAAATLSAHVRTPRGAAVRDAVIWAIPEGRAVPRPTGTAVMDQKDRMFVPHVLAVQTGTSVNFPNSDNVRHHVYSFSPAKTFQLPLYKGNPPSPVVFDKAGVVSLGCNIHDRMSAFIVVVDTPWFATTAADGSAEIANLPPGRYVVRMWYSDLRDDPEARQVEVTATGTRDVAFVTGKRAAAPVR